MRRLVRVGVLVLAITVALVAAVQAPASARARKRHHKRHHHPPSTVEVADTASLSSDGRTVDVVLQVRCGGFDPTNIRVTVQQNAIKGSGNSGSNYKCTAQPQRLVVSVTAASGAFHPGTAVVSIRATFRSTSATKDVNSSRGIQLT
jgi:hypothetical protein